jgi:predicted RNase H-like HicB family nuclease
MGPKSLVLRCYSERKGSFWVAVCIDLCLAAQGETAQDARQRLHLQIQEYLHDALAGENQPHAAELLSRKAPFSQMAKYHTFRLMETFHLLRKGAFNLFSEVFPVIPKNA